MRRILTTSPGGTAWRMAAAVAMLLCSTTTAAGQIHVLNGQIERIDAMIVKNDNTQDQIRDIRVRLSELAGRYSAEIQKEQAAGSIRTLKNAQSHPRINANLRLLQRIGAYESVLNRRLGELNAVKERLRYLRRRAVDDVKLMQTLAGVEADALLGQIDQVLDHNQLLMDRPVVNVPTLKPVAAETAWRRALARR